MRPIPSSAVAFVANHEGFRSMPYRDSGGIWTDGFGNTNGVIPGQAVTRDEALAKLAVNMQEAANRLALRLKPDILSALTETQYSALLSFVFNVGAGPSWTIWKTINARDFHGVPAQLRRFVYAGGKKMISLLVRRNAEAALWLSTMPQKPVAPHVGTGPVVAASAPVAAIVASQNHALIPWFLAIGAALAVAGIVYCYVLSRRYTTMAVSQAFTDALTNLTGKYEAKIAKLQADLTAAQNEAATVESEDIAAIQAATPADEAPPSE